MIYNKINHKYYIGSAAHIIRKSKNSYGFIVRWADHINKLRKNKHVNPKLQYAWNKYGEDSFKFIILEKIVDINLILVREQSYLDNCNLKNNGYNILITATSHHGRIFTSDWKNKISQSLLGKPRSLSLKIKLGTPVLQYSLSGEFLQEYYSLQNASDFTFTNRQDIGKCCLNKLKSANNFQWKYKHSDKIITQYLKLIN